MVKRINAAGKHLLELINGVLDLSKIEAGRIELYLKDFAGATVPPLVRDIAVVIHPLAGKNRNRIEVRCGPEAGVVHADLTKVRQALFNLLSNACKFPQGGTVTLTVERAADPGRDWLGFAVTDTRIGMMPEQMARLFESFGRADASVSRRFGGAGLGLALSRCLARMMNGDITVASVLGQGSTFALRLPVRVAESAPEAARRRERDARRREGVERTLLFYVSGSQCQPISGSGSMCFALARSRSPHFRMGSPRLRRRLALARSRSLHCRMRSARRRWLARPWSRPPTTINVARSRSPRSPESLASPPVELAQAESGGQSCFPRALSGRNVPQYPAPS